MRYVQVEEEDFAQANKVNKSIKQLWDELKEANEAEWGPVVVPLANLTSSRFLQDVHYAKTGLYVHRVTNNHPDVPVQITFIDFLPKYLRPYFSTLQISFSTLDKKGQTLPENAHANVEYMYDRRGNSYFNVTSMRLQPKQEVEFSFKVRKLLLQFEEYPNDPNRGFSLPSTPIAYHMIQDSDDLVDLSRHAQMHHGGDIEQQIERRKQIAQKRIHGSIDAPMILVQIPEPDFSMPFNVNSVSNLIIGFLIVNLFTILVHPEVYLEKNTYLKSLKEKKIQLEKERL